MDKVGKPRGLIAYSTLTDYELHSATARTAGRDAARSEQRKISLSHIARPRTILYFALWSLIGFGMIAAIIMRDSLDITVLHDRAPRFVMLSDGSVRNGYTLKIANKALQDRTFMLSLEGMPDASMWVAEEGEARSRSVSVTVPPDAVRDVRLFVVRGRDSAEAAPFRFIVEDPASGETTASEARFEAAEGNS
jgi:polyferredoxin